MSLRTTESTQKQHIELARADIVLFDADTETDPDSFLTSSFPFALPLTPDTPQCIHTPQSALAHLLTATLYPADESESCPPLVKSITVHTRRYIPHTHTLGISPVSRILDTPTRVEVEVPRTIFTALEPVPIYVTVPSPRRELVVEHGLRLRNIKAELVRTVHVKQDSTLDEEDVSDIDLLDSDSDADSDDDLSHGHGLPLGFSMPTHNEKPPVASSSSSSSAAQSADATPVVQSRRTVYKTVISRSGALCRFHTSRPVRLRFVLHQSSPQSSPSSSNRALPAEEFGLLDSDTECASITQSTLFHSVSFRIRIHATFRNMSSHTEQVSTVSIPITFLPPPAPLPEVEDSIGSAYHKKHDRPPARTVRGEDVVLDAAPHYEEGQAGPSFTASMSSEPPPFEDRDAPPPSFAEASTSRPPTFQESEREIFVPSHDPDQGTDPAAAAALLDPPRFPRLVIAGEGTLFGFPASSQFDGHPEEVERAGNTTPPPTLEMATLDPNVSDLARLNLDAPEHAMHALNLALEQQEEEAAGGPPPPPPPPMDDPSDPPPSIHSEYRSREGVPHQTTTLGSLGGPSSASPPTLLPIPPPPRSAGEGEGEAPVGGGPPSPHAHAPPPYLTAGDGDHEGVARPPPYVDVMPEHAS